MSVSPPSHALSHRTTASATRPNRSYSIPNSFPSTETSCLAQCTSTFQDLVVAAGYVFFWAVELHPGDDGRIFYTNEVAKWVDSEETSKIDRHCLDICSSMQRFRKSRRCMNGDRGKPPEDPFKPFSRCAGCGLVVYCSKECQRNAWTCKGVHHQYSHRLVCKDLGRLRAVWPAQTEEIQFELIPELRFTLFAARLGCLLRKSLTGWEKMKSKPRSQHPKHFQTERGST